MAPRPKGKHHIDNDMIMKMILIITIIRIFKRKEVSLLMPEVMMIKDNDNDITDNDNHNDDDETLLKRKITSKMMLPMICHGPTVSHITVIQSSFQRFIITPCLNSIFRGKSWDAEIRWFPLVNCVVIEMD